MAKHAQRYYKATLKGGVSHYDNRFVYRVGLNIEPNADDSHWADCGWGLHLAKTIQAARSLSGHRDEEIYLAKPGVILGEGRDKVRCRYVWIVRKLTKKEITKYDFQEEEERIERERREALLRGLPPEPICGWDWINKHSKDFTQDDFNKLKIEISTGSCTMNLTVKMKAKDRRQVIRSAVKV